jgi:aryl-alcohol dehydrogenase-like predicted oxidoreductase
MRYRLLGNSGVRVSEAALGTIRLWRLELRLKLGDVGDVDDFG